MPKPKKVTITANELTRALKALSHLSIASPSTSASGGTSAGAEFEDGTWEIRDGSNTRIGYLYINTNNGTTTERLGARPGTTLPLLKGNDPYKFEEQGADGFTFDPQGADNHNVQFLKWCCGATQLNLNQNDKLTYYKFSYSDGVGGEYAAP